MADDTCVLEWRVERVRKWLEESGIGHLKYLVCDMNKIDGRALLMLQEEDLRRPPLELSSLKDIKHLVFSINYLRAGQEIADQRTRLALGMRPLNAIQAEVDRSSSSDSGSDEDTPAVSSSLSFSSQQQLLLTNGQVGCTTGGPCPSCSLQQRSQKNNISSKLDPERRKTALAMMYGLCVSWLTAFVMTVVHDRVPDMKKYPPLPDIILDNIPHISWAFTMSEITGMTLLSIWMIVLLFHKHRFILARRFFSIAGTIFLLRCVTMLITSLSVPGAHLDCKPSPYGTWAKRLHAAYVIWSGAGLSLQGVRTCGDYMFSGHTVSLTLLNFFITEYTSRRIHFLHTFTWLCNCFGIFFILAAHEHYSIDVFVAFYITSRLFLYYHTLVNNRALARSHQGQDAKRTWLYFPLFSFFEQNIDGKIPNEFALPFSPADVTSLLEKVKAQYSSLAEGRRSSSSKLTASKQKHS